MKLFNSFEKVREDRVRPRPKIERNPLKKASAERKKAEASAHRAELSPSEIREKIKAYEMKNNKSLKAPVEEPGPMGLNDPNNSNTTEKLKEALRTGSVMFSEKTKQVLAEILKDK